MNICDRCVKKLKIKLPKIGNVEIGLCECCNKKKSYLYCGLRNICMCPICKRKIKLEKHHLIPRHKKGKNEKSNYMYLCKDCHAQLHLLYNNNFLRDSLNTLEKILKDEKMIKFGKWAGKQKKRVTKREAKNKYEWINKA